MVDLRGALDDDLRHRGIAPHTRQLKKQVHAVLLLTSREGGLDQRIEHLRYIRIVRKVFRFEFDFPRSLEYVRFVADRGKASLRLHRVHPACVQG